jgi:hypothetical protein
VAVVAAVVVVRPARTGTSIGKLDFFGVVVVVVVNQALRPTQQVVLPAALPDRFLPVPNLNRVVQAHLVVLGQVEQEPPTPMLGIRAMVVLAVLVAHEVRLVQVEEIILSVSALFTSQPAHIVAAVPVVPYRAMQI